MDSINHSWPTSPSAVHILDTSSDILAFSACATTMFISVIFILGKEYQIYYIKSISDFNFHGPGTFRRPARKTFTRHQKPYLGTLGINPICQTPSGTVRPGRYLPGLRSRRTPYQRWRPSGSCQTGSNSSCPSLRPSSCMCCSLS